MITECRDMLAQIAEKTARIEEKNKVLKSLVAQMDMARRLQSMPGVGPLTALAIDAFAPDMAQFRCDREFAAWLGLVPTQHSTGGKSRLGQVSKAGQADTAASDDRGYDTVELIGAKDNTTWLMACTYVGEKTSHAGGNRTGQQDGEADLGDVDKERGLQGSVTGCSSMRATLMSMQTLTVWGCEKTMT